MRVIAGSRRSLPLKTPAGTDTRPTEDRTKETLLMYYRAIYMGRAFWTCFPEAEELRLKH